MMARYRDSERGISLMIVLLVMMLLSALMIGFMTNIMADTRSSGVDRDETQAYAVAHAGMEKLTSDLAALFLNDYSPNAKQITDAIATKPTMAGFGYIDPDGTTGYKVTFTALKSGMTGPCPANCETLSTPITDASRLPAPDDPTTGTTIAAGPYQGFKGLVTHYNIMVTARSVGSCAATDLNCITARGGSEVRMRRELQTVAVPVFQFGLFSESSLAFHSSQDFNFGGRVHTNANLYLAGGNGNPAGQLWLSDKVTAFGEVVRRYLDNGLLSTGDYPGAVNMAKGTGVYRELSASANSGKGEGSVEGDIGSAQNSVWTDLSVGTYNGYIRNGRTGAKRLDLPLVTAGAQPIDLIRRPREPVACPVTVLAEPACKPLVYKQRYYQQASLRILLSDTAADITGLPDIDTATNPVSLEGVLPASIGGVPVALSAGTGNYKSLLSTSLLGGFIKIERQSSAGVWTDVTGEILALGITGRNISNGTQNTAFTSWSPNGTSNTNACLATEPQANAIIRLQRVKDVPSTHSGLTAAPNRYDCAFAAGGTTTALATDFWPLALYDTREGLRRDEKAPGNLYYGGVMYYVELDTNNLAKWFKGTIGTTGTQAKNDNGGYVVYFSDRRNNRNSNSANATPDPRWAADKETGEYGYEDIINPSIEDGMTDTGGTADAGEDVNADGVLETYGKLPNDGKGTHNSVSSIMLSPITNSSPLDSSLRPTTGFGDDNNSLHVLRGNRPLLFRRALKLTGGAALRTSTLTGLTVVSENPVYVEGNYNSTSSPAPAATETHIAAAIIADSITALSNHWNDITSFKEGKGGSAHAGNGMAADDTAYRFAAVMGKNISFTQPTGWDPETNFGMDGGAHNLIRQQEYWKDDNFYYRGSIVSFYISRQATGIFKCCSYVYKPPDNRIFNFDADFLLPDKLPPGTPMFRDVNTLTFRQILRPNQ